MKYMFLVCVCYAAILTGCKTQQQEERFDASNIQSISLDAMHTTNRVYIAKDKVYLPVTVQDSLKY